MKYAQKVSLHRSKQNKQTKTEKKKEKVIVQVNYNTKTANSLPSEKKKSLHCKSTQYSTCL